MSPSTPSPDGPLMALVRAADAELATNTPGGAILRVIDSPDAELAWFPLEGAHPLDHLLGFVAPPHWRALGVSCAGRAHRLDTAGRVRRQRDSPAVTVTHLVDRSGDTAGLMRQRDEVTALPGRADGVVADACRRALSLATAPPPPSTADLWALCWLDRLVDRASRADAASALRDWPTIAHLHPAASPPLGVRDPASLVASANDLTEAWTWARLRAEPMVLDLPGGRPSTAIAGWMDDGMCARWLLAALPAGDDLLAAVHDLLPAALAQAVDQVVQASCRW
jgi:hypothetical protein